MDLVKRQAWTMAKLGDHALGRRALAGGHCSLAVWRTRGGRELIANNAQGQDALTSACDSTKQIMVPTPDSLIQPVRDRVIECAPPTSSQVMR